VVEAAAEKGATTLLMPVTTRKQLADLNDDVATKVTIVYYSEVKDALVKALME
jgi:ATP-dependent Lon protease